MDNMSDTDEIHDDPVNSFILDKRYQPTSNLQIPNELTFTLGLKIHQLFNNRFQSLLKSSGLGVEAGIKRELKYYEEFCGKFAGLASTYLSKR
jgi:hypothetical protein